MPKKNKKENLSEKIEEKINEVSEILYGISDAVQFCQQEGKEPIYLIPLIKFAQQKLNDLIKIVTT